MNPPPERNTTRHIAPRRSKNKACTRGRGDRAVEGGEDLDGAGRSVLDLQLQPMAATLGAGSAGITAELLAPEEQRRGGLDDLHRRALDAGIGGGREPVLPGPCASAAVGGDGDGARHRGRGRS
jgi:hypothetical protein